MATVLEERSEAAAPRPGGWIASALRRGLRDWRYAPGGKRGLRLDLLRGFAVFAMVVDHIGGASWLYALSGGNRFFVSAAEGFVFISGVTVGIVYGGVAPGEGGRPAGGKLLPRPRPPYL